MKTILYILFFLITFSVSLNSQTTSHRYLDSFNNPNNGWAIVNGEGNISVQNGKLYVQSDDDVIHLILPMGGTKNDFSLKIFPDEGSGIQGGGFGRMGFKSLIAYHIEDDSIDIMYSPDITSYDNPNFIRLTRFPMPQTMNSMRMDVTRSGNNLLINAFINDISFYNGQINNADEGLFNGQILVYLIKDDDNPFLTWSIDAIDVEYNPYVEQIGSYTEEFNNVNIPWFKFGDFDLLAQSININNGNLNFNYSGNEPRWYYVLTPVGSVNDFSVEVEGGGNTGHNSMFEIARFNDYNNYVTLAVEDDFIKLGYSNNNPEPTFINSIPFDASTISKVKFSVEGSPPNLILNGWINDQLVITGSINDASEKLRSGQLVFGYGNGNSINAFISKAVINYTQNVTDIEDENISTTDFQLFQNYPNPFNPNTVISYQLAVESKVKLVVYDLLGNEVAVLVKDEKSAGKHEIIFSTESFGRSLSSGVYYYRLFVISEKGEFSIVKKLVLLK